MAEYEIKVLGSGCEGCHNMFEWAKKEVETRGIDADVIYNTNVLEIMDEYEYMRLPAILVDEIAVVKGKMLSEEDVHNLFEQMDL